MGERRRQMIRGERRRQMGERRRQTMRGERRRQMGFVV